MQYYSIEKPITPHEALVPVPDVIGDPNHLLYTLALFTIFGEALYRLQLGVDLSERSLELTNREQVDAMYAAHKKARQSYVGNWLQYTPQTRSKYTVIPQNSSLSTNLAVRQPASIWYEQPRVIPSLIYDDYGRIYSLLGLPLAYASSADPCSLMLEYAHKGGKLATPTLNDIIFPPHTEC